MNVDVIMPQMGESITEGTIVKWLKAVGDKVERDEPLFEISTEKVDVEIPSNADGILAAINVKEGDTVVYSKYGGTEIKFEGQEYLILSARDLLAIIA